jgi:hypothetical protein
MEITPATAEDLEILITFRDEASCWLRAWGHRPVVQPRENLLYGFKLPAPSAKLGIISLPRGLVREPSDHLNRRHVHFHKPLKRIAVVSDFSIIQVLRANHSFALCGKIGDLESPVVRRHPAVVGMRTLAWEPQVRTKPVASSQRLWVSDHLATSTEGACEAIRAKCVSSRAASRLR